MTATLWIGGAALAVLLALLVGWRLDRAARTVDQILTEELERPAHDNMPDYVPDCEPEEQPTRAPASDPGDETS